MLLLLLCVAAAAASTVTLQVHGEQNVRVLAENEPVYVPAGTAPRVRICLVFGWLYEPDMQHTTRCVVATIDCLCYTWQNAQSGAQCVDIALVQNTTLTWYLLPLPNVTQLLAAAVLQYQILAGRWPAYSIHDFAEVHCAVADHSHQPSAYMVQHTVPVIVLTPQARLYFYYNT